MMNKNGYDKPSGRKRWIQCRIYPSKDENGRLLNLVHMIEDITERKHAEKMILDKEQFIQSVFMSIQDHIAVLDQNGIIQSVNKSWMDFAMNNNAVSMETVSPGQNYLDICQKAVKDNDESARIALDGINSVLNGNRKLFEMEYPCNSEFEERWFRMTVMPLIRPQGGAVITHTNITARKEAMQKLLQAEERHRTVADFTYDWEWWENPDQTFEYMSPSAERITGYALEEFTSNKSLLEDIVLNEDKAVWQQHRKNYIQKKFLIRYSFGLERKMARSDGLSMFVSQLQILMEYSLVIVHLTGISPSALNHYKRLKKAN
jgi:PAS domain-containing protein